MIAYVKGNLAESSQDKVIIDVNGIGYLVAIPSSLFSKLPSLGEQVMLYTVMIVRETEQMLFGFLSTLEKELFEKFIGVSGIGPKLALSLLGHIPLPELKAAIETKDIATLSRIPGIGKKSAERISLELKDAMKNYFPTAVSYSAKAPAPKIQDAISALVRLGYTQMTAQNALKKTLQEHTEDAHLAELITTALKHV